MKAERLKEIRERCEAATPEVWQQSHYAPSPDSRRRTHPEDADRYEAQEELTIRGPGIVGTPSCNQLFRIEGMEATGANAAFIAHAREDVPFLLAEIERLSSQAPCTFELERGIVYAMALCQNILDGQTWPFPQEDFVRRVYDVLSTAISQAKLHGGGSSQAPLPKGDHNAMLSAQARAEEGCSFTAGEVRAFQAAWAMCCAWHNEIEDTQAPLQVSDEMVERATKLVASCWALRGLLPPYRDDSRSYVLSFGQYKQIIRDAVVGLGLDLKESTEGSRAAQHVQKRIDNGERLWEHIEAALATPRGET